MKVTINCPPTKGEVDGIMSKMIYETDKAALIIRRGILDVFQVVEISLQGCYLKMDINNICQLINLLQNQNDCELTTAIIACKECYLELAIFKLIDCLQVSGIQVTVNILQGGSITLSTITKKIK